MTEEKKEQIRKRILIAESVLALLMVVYLVYIVVTKNSNSTLFHVLAGVILFAVLILNDVVEPYLTKTFEEMNEFRKNAYKKYVLCDAVSYLGLLLFIMTFGGDVTAENGLLKFAMGISVGLVLLLSAIRQGQLCANGIAGMAQGHDVQTNTMIYAALPEFYAILALVATFLV